MINENQKYSLEEIACLSITPKQNSEIVQMLSQGIINKQSAKEVLDILIKKNLETLVQIIKQKYSIDISIKKKIKFDRHNKD